MKFGKLLPVILALLLALSACAESSVANRISFYYQLDGGITDMPGKWDRMLADRLQALYGHDRIYENASTNSYLTGRGCVLFSYSHAYQYLFGRAQTEADMADILYNYIAVNPKWSNSGSSASPPNAATYYASYLTGRGITRLASDQYGTFTSLSTLLNSGKGVCIISVRGYHDVIAVGTTTHDGVQYVHIVDSILSGTLNTDRLSTAYSMDFGTVYSRSNAGSYNRDVHEYWVSYSDFSSKCTIKSAFRAGKAPAANPLRAESTRLVLTAGQSGQIRLSRGGAAVTEAEFVSSAPGVCSVNESGLVTFVSEGYARVTCRDTSGSTASVDVYCYTCAGGQIIDAKEGIPLPLPTVTGALPDGCFAAADEEGLTDVRVYTADGKELFRVSAIVRIGEGGRVLNLPPSLVTVGERAFEGCAAEIVRVPASVKSIAPYAFAGSNVKYVILATNRTAYAENSFPKGTVFITDPTAFD